MTSQSAHKEAAETAQRPPTGPEAYRRAADLLEQAFETRELPYAIEGGAPAIVATLPESERMLYIQAAQGYAALAQAAAIAEQTGSRGPGDIDTAWSQIVWPLSTSPGNGAGQ